MTTRLWTITEIATGAVLAPAFETDSFDQHPKDRGWAWDAATQRATRIAARPDEALQRWDGAGWADDLDALRSRRWDEAKRLRDQAEWSGCATPLGPVDTDPDSQRKVTGAVQMALIAVDTGAAFAIDWTMRDNSVVSHDATAIIALGMLVGQHVAACHAAGTAKRTAIDAASDAAAIAAVDVAAGWPGAGA